MPDYHQFTTTRITQVDIRKIVSDYHTQTNDLSMNLSSFPNDFQHFTGKKATTWTPAQISGVQNAIDTGEELTSQREAQYIIDKLPIFQKAILSLIVKQFNTVRSKLQPPLPPLTLEQVIQAIRDEAATIS